MALDFRDFDHNYIEYFENFFPEVLEAIKTWPTTEVSRKVLNSFEEQNVPDYEKHLFIVNLFRAKLMPETDDYAKEIKEGARNYIEDLLMELSRDPDADMEDLACGIIIFMESDPADFHFRAFMKGLGETNEVMQQSMWGTPRSIFPDPEPP